MKRCAAFLIVLFLSVPSLAVMGGGGATPCGAPMGMMQMMEMGDPMMMKAVGPSLMAGCHADFEALGVKAEVREIIEEKRFELQKEMIRASADLRVLEMELSRMLEKRGFDFEAALKKQKELGSFEAKIRKAHLEFLQFLSTKLDDGTWKKLKAHIDRSMSGFMRDKDSMPSQGRTMMMEKMGDMGGMGSMMMDKGAQPEVKPGESKMESPPMDMKMDMKMDGK
ncbi:hypothetical protein EPN96_00290 [bacterium]|nr:MAG: hypothetical protein EPN96_00290 [bacterium]